LTKRRKWTTIQTRCDPTPGSAAPLAAIDGARRADLMLSEPATIAIKADQARAGTVFV
jgi:hypothetical protein